MTDHLPDSNRDERFDSTNWVLIDAARQGDSPRARQALSDLCAAYWYPLYAYVRRKGHSADRSQDLTQGFFAGLLGHDFLGNVDPEKGKFRSFLLASCQNYLANQREHDHALKRGGNRLTLSLSIDLSDAESQFAVEPSHNLTPERLFERRWAITLLGRALEWLGTELARAGKGPLFDRLRPALLGDGAAAPYAVIAEDMGMTVDAVKAAALRVRRRFRELVREEVARTLVEPGDIDDEIRELFEIFGS